MWMIAWVDILLLVEFVQVAAVALCSTLARISYPLAVGQ